MSPEGSLDNPPTLGQGGEVDGPDDLEGLEEAALCNSARILASCAPASGGLAVRAVPGKPPGWLISSIVSESTDAD